MLLRVLFVFIGLVYFSNAFHNETMVITAGVEIEDDEPEDFEEFVGRIASETVKRRKDFPWMVFLIDCKEGEFLGYGAIISVKWVLSMSVTLDCEPMKNLRIYRDAESIEHYEKGFKHTIREYHFCDDYEDKNKNVLALFRPCPRMPECSIIDLPYPGIRYPVGYEAFPSKYDTAVCSFAEGAQRVGEKCECEDTIHWDPKIMFCLANDAVVYAESNDYFIPVVVNKKIGGFMMGPQLTQASFDGEPVIDIGKFRDWICSIAKF